MFRDSTSGSAHVRRKDVLWFEAATLECKSTCVLWPLEGSMRAAQCDDSQIFLLLSEAVTERKPSGGCIQRSNWHLSWVCKVKVFFKAMLFKTCLHDETKEKNTKFTMQERTCWRLCTIVILLMCKYMPMFGMLLLFICCKWEKKNINHKAIRLPSCPLTLRTAEVTRLF